MLQIVTARRVRDTILSDNIAEPREGLGIVDEDLAGDRGARI